MTTSPKELILASRSPRRRELLIAGGYSFEVIPAAEEAEDAQRPGEQPAELVMRLARQKAADVARRITSGLVLGCDTLVECDGRILGKPVDVEDARAMLESLSGREHCVLTGLCLWPTDRGEPRTEVGVTTLRLDRFADEQLDEYLASNAWQGKAGAFGYQDRLGWVHVIEGSESNVVGLPMELFARMLEETV